MNNFMSNPNAMGLLGFGSSMLESAGPSPVRTSLGQALGRGVGAGLGGYQAGLFMQQQQAESQRKQQQLMQQLEAQQFIQNYANNPENKRDVRSMSNAMIQSGNPFLLNQALKMAPLMPKVKSVEKVMQNGQAVLQPIMDTGEFGQVGGLPAAEKLAFQNLGGQTAALNPYTGEAVSTYAQTMAPGEQARLSESQRQFGMSYGLAQQKFSDERSRANMQMARPTFKDGYWITPPTAENPQGSITPTEFASPPKGSQAYKEKSAEKILEITKEAKQILEKETVTGSGIGSIADTVLGFAGVSSPGAQSTAKLKTLQGQLVMSMPRMEGPQSDKDVALYREMAGMIGEPSIPKQTRLAAIAEIERLQKKYAGQQEIQAPNGWKIELIGE